MKISNYVNGNRDTNISNDKYSTTEVKIGTWIDGKPIYRRYVAKTFNLSATTWLAIEPMSDYNIENIVNCSIRRSTVGVFYPLTQNVNSNVSIYYYGPVDECTGYVLEYTKTTDTAVNN